MPKSEIHTCHCTNCQQETGHPDQELQRNALILFPRNFVMACTTHVFQDAFQLYAYHSECHSIPSAILLPTSEQTPEPGKASNTR